MTELSGVQGMTDKERLQHEEELYFTVSDTQARDWNPVLRQKRSFDTVNRIITSKWNHVNLLLSNVNLREKYAPARFSTLSEIMNLVKPLFEKVVSGQLPRAHDILATSLVYDVATGDLRYCLSAYRRVLSGVIFMDGLHQEISELQETFLNPQNYRVFKSGEGRACNDIRAKIAAALLDANQPLFQDDNESAKLYGGHRRAVKKQFIYARDKIAERLEDDLQTVSPGGRYFQNLTYWGMITKQLEEDLALLSKKQRINQKTTSYVA